MLLAFLIVCLCVVLLLFFSVCMQLIWADVVVGAVFVSLSALLVIVVVFHDVVVFWEFVCG